MEQENLDCRERGQMNHSAQQSQKLVGEKLRRAYRACSNCRTRKARCIFRDSRYNQPCERCQRENKQCNFLPSRRGGRANIDNARALRATANTAPLQPISLALNTTDSSAREQLQEASSNLPLLSNDGVSTSEMTVIEVPNSHITIAEPETIGADLLPTGEHTLASQSSNEQGSPQSTRPQKLSISKDLNLDTETLAFSLIRNPSDALNILARAAEHMSDNESHSDEESVKYSSNMDANGNGTTDTSTIGFDNDDNASGSIHNRSDEAVNYSDQHRSDSSVNPNIISQVSISEGSQTSESSGHHIRPSSSFQDRISEFSLVKLGLLNPTQLRTFLSIYFSRHHHYFPIIPFSSAPLTDELVSEFCVHEPYLLTAMVIVSARYENRAIHDRCWKYMQNLISGLMFGTTPTVGAIESLLLLSENIPHMPGINTIRVHYHEECMAWTLIGLAIRLSYFLGLDQKTLIRPTDVMDDETHRERLVWTYCYLHDRQESIRLGKAFWSRGPGLCFQNPDVGVSIVLDSAMNFPTLSTKNGNPEDYASHVQAQIELTQILTNIHDTLYLSRDRTIALVWVGEYYRILDEYTRTFTAFRLTWQQKSWHTFPLNETMWITFHYAKLYAYGFAFQSHLRRKLTRYKEDPNAPPINTSLGIIVFPRGLTGSPDAKFILESEKAAVELLTICIDKLHNGGALAYLPSRFYDYISYAVVFLIKVVFTGAVIPKDQQNVMSLVRRTISTFVELSLITDKQHPLVRRINQLYTLINKLWSAEGGPISSISAMTTTVNTPKNHKSHNQNVGERQADYSNNDTSSGLQPQSEMDSENPLSILDEGLANIMDLLPGEFQPTESECSDSGGADLTSLLSYDIDSEIWMSYFDSWSYDQA
ncbi:uncharacterized protein V1516DRAFT_679389, partial [Lipomyces oligophaga]|uniref:uncharacterized protein n=1 Tax=Lipomyces oligophaga TaxID=45792 RepID=UPI0034CF822E